MSLGLKVDQRQSHMGFTRKSFYQKNGNLSGRKTVKCTTLTKALSEQIVGQRQRPGSSSPIRSRTSTDVAELESAAGNGFGELSVPGEMAERCGSPRRLQTDTNATRISWVDARDDPSVQELQQHPQQQLQHQQQHPQHEQRQSRKWTRGSARASMKSLQMQPDEEGGGLRVGGTSPRRRGDVSPRGLERPEAAIKHLAEAGQCTDTTFRGFEVVRDAGMGQLPHAKQAASAAAPRSPRAGHGPHIQRQLSTGTLSTAPSPNMPGYRDRLRTAASTTSLSIPTPNSPVATPRPRPGDNSAIASSAGVGSFDSVHGADGGSIHSLTLGFPSKQSKLTDTVPESGLCKQAMTRSMNDLRDPTPQQRMLRRASSMRSVGGVALAASTKNEKLNRVSIYAQRDSIANVDEVYGPYHGLSRRQGHQNDPKKFWKNTWRFLPDLINDPDKEYYDDQVAHAMFGCSVLPGVAESISEETTQRPKAAAFTDRSIRRREGMNCNAALKAADASSIADMDGHKDSDRAGCHPFARRPAGLISSQGPHQILQSDRAGTRGSMQTQIPLTRSRCRSVSPNLDSCGITMTWAEYPNKAEQQQLHQEEKAFHQQMCRKAKPTTQAAGTAAVSFSPRFVRPNLDLEASSEQYVRMNGPSVLPAERVQKKQQGWAGQSKMDTPQRGHVATTLSPRSDDPPLANKSISGCRRADGENKFHISKESERFFLYANPTMFRYEVASQNGDFGRSCSLPPEYERRVNGKRRTVSVHQEEEFFRERPAFVSHNVQAAIQQSKVAEDDAQVRAQRLVEDKRFYDLCNITDNARTQMIADIEALANTQTVSANVANSLCWSE